MRLYMYQSSYGIVEISRVEASGVGIKFGSVDEWRKFFFKAAITLGDVFVWGVVPPNSLLEYVSKDYEGCWNFYGYDGYFIESIWAEVGGTDFVIWEMPQ